MMGETLGTFPRPVLHVACRYCKRSGRYRRDRLVAPYGENCSLDEFVRDIAKNCGMAAERTGGKGCNGPYVEERRRVAF